MLSYSTSPIKEDTAQVNWCKIRFESPVAKGSTYNAVYCDWQDVA